MASMGSVVTTWQSPEFHTHSHGFVGKPVFENALLQAQGRYSFAPREGSQNEKVSSLIEHLQNHISYYDSFETRVPLASDRKITKLFGGVEDIIDRIQEGAQDLRDKFLPPKTTVTTGNQVFTAGDLNIPLQLTKGKLVYQDNPSITTKEELAVAAYQITEITRKFYQDQHGVNLNQLLGSAKKPLPLQSIVHYQGKAGSKTALDNAFWDGRQMVYGSGRLFKPLVLEPTVGHHEIDHLVSQKEAGRKISSNGKGTGLNYSGDAGGLNEANSDQAATAAVQKSNGVMVPKAEDFKIGKGIIIDDPEGCLRDMANPGEGYHSKSLGTDPQKGYGNYQNWAVDSENVDPHLSSAVGNKWFAEAAITLGKPTWEVMDAIRFNTLGYCKPNSLYTEYAALSMKSVVELYGEDSAIMNAVGNAWRTVKVM